VYPEWSGWPDWENFSPNWLLFCMGRFSKITEVCRAR
jgi:hypothetical protein